MLSVQTNMLAENAARQLQINTKKKEKNAGKLASGYKINRAADDAAGLSISEKMRRQIRGLQKGKENITDGISWVQIGDGAMEEIAQMIHRMEELAVKGANGTLQAADRAAIDEEIKQLKREINDIAKWTTFNEKKVFDNDQIDIDIEGSLNDLQIYNASYDDATGEVTYGGFLFRGQRISWDTFAPDMVTYDKATHQQIFKGGSYGFQDIDGCTFYVDCEPGATVPTITRNIKVEAADGGISVDGVLIPWNQLYDEEGKTAAETCHDGTWYADYKGLTISYFFPDGTIQNRRDMADAISSLNTHDSKVKYHLKEFYTGPSEEQAVDVVKVDDLRLSNHLAKDLLHDSQHNQSPVAGVTQMEPHQVGYLNEVDDTGVYEFSCIVKAAAKNPTDPTDPTNPNPPRDGVWLEYEYKCKYRDANGDEKEDVIRVEAENSYRTWEEMGLKDWFNGWDIKGGRFQYTYTGDDSDDATVNDTYLSFNFTLSDVTSKDSVVDGLDEMRIDGGSIKTKYATVMEPPADTHILQAKISSKNQISFEEEKALGRDFDQEKADDVAHNNLEYDAGTEKISLQFQDGANNPVIEYEGDGTTQKRRFESDLQTYGRYVESLKKNLALAGKDPQQADYTSRGLADLVGRDKITMSGYFEEVITVDAGMKLTDGEKWYSSGEIGKSYPAAKIDFTGLGNGAINMDLLTGTGFNSTCKTCNRHYSIMFTDGGAEKLTDEGYGYSIRNQDPNFTLQIDLSTLKAQGVDSARELADAIVDITSDCYDFHYTQYGSKDGVLYVFDNREQSEPTTDATFEPWPFQSIDTGDYKFSVQTDDGRSVDLSYKYRFSDFADNIVVEMQQNNAGAYVKKTDAAGGISYEAYDPATHGSVADADRYDLVTTYRDMAGNPAADLNAAKNSYVTGAFDTMLNGTEIQLNALDYTKMKISGDENKSVAVRSLFDTEFIRDVADNGINIRCSAQDGDRTTIPRFGVNTFSLKLFRAGAKTQEQADRTMSITKEALRRLNERRTTYGAMQNRLEHAYNMRDNTQENTQAAESRLRDSDVALEMLEFSNQNILLQAGVSMLAHANQDRQSILSLLQ